MITTVDELRAILANCPGRAEVRLALRPGFRGMRQIANVALLGYPVMRASTDVVWIAATMPTNLPVPVEAWQQTWRPIKPGTDQL